MGPAKSLGTALQDQLGGAIRIGNHVIIPQPHHGPALCRDRILVDQLKIQGCDWAFIGPVESVLAG